MLTDYCIVWEEKTPSVYTMVCTQFSVLLPLPPVPIALGDVCLSSGIKLTGAREENSCTYLKSGSV